MAAVSSASGAPVPLQWRTLPLDARVLIEASAGTGKTYNIALIYLRLLLERALGVEQILVTTFTDAAAQELRERLRLRIIEAGKWLQAHVDALTAEARSPLTCPLEDDSLASYLAALCPDHASARLALRRVQLARADLDRAPISTIHALCQRIQRDFPLQSHAAFVSPAVADEDDLMRECIEDFWRRRYLAGSIDDDEVFVAEAGPADVLRDVAALATSADHLIEADGRAIVRQHLTALANAASVAQLRALADNRLLFARSNSAIIKRLRGIAGVLESEDDMPARLAVELGACFEDAEIDRQQPASAPERLRDHPLIRQLQQLRGLLKTYKVSARGAVLAAAAAECREQVPRRAHQRNVLTFSMLIDGVHARLCGADADATLADCLAKAFPAALIDEFQDTDQRQFSIFDRIYRDADGTPRGSLVMIGDPKQAIYGFRGGDIAAYLRASAQTTLRFSLDVNQRSSRALVGALNALYGDAGGGFGASGIDYRAVTAAGKVDERPWAIDGVAVGAPLALHLFRGDACDAKGVPLSALNRLEALALEDCARRITEQLNDVRQTIDGKRVGPADIAVLVSTNAQVAALRKLLLERGVPCVGSGRGSVFDGEVARDLELVLHGVLNADDDDAVRGALSTRLLGADFADFREWHARADAFERELDRFQSWREQVRMRGVLAVVEEIIALRAPALLATADGERTLTDLRHLGELLAEQASSQQGLEGVLGWLVVMRRDGGKAGDRDASAARRLRVESDAQRVQLLTVHASKGLQFPIVYLPLPWRIADRSGVRAPSVLRFHDAAGNACIDLGSTDFSAHCERHFEEDLQERQRLLYVALTRAIHAVRVYWVDRATSPGSGAAPAAPAWKTAAIDVLLEAATRRAGLDCSELALAQLAASLPGVALYEPSGGNGETFAAPLSTEALRATQAPLPALRPFYWQHSFSGLARQAGDAAAAPADITASEPIEAAPVDAGDDPRLSALYSLRGPRFGVALHALLERAGPEPLWPAQRAWVERELALRGVRARDESAADAVERVARLADRARLGDLGDGLRLAHLSPSARVREFQFQFPVQHVAVAPLRALCAQHGHADAVPAGLNAVVLNGMLTGFADLVFEWQGRYHVLDYKTNWLGARLDGYQGAALDAAMGEHHYALQALLYTVALHRYLRQRMAAYVAQRHLGESWYVFVRAVGLAPGAGVWRRAWPPALIEALDAAFAGAAGMAA